MSRKTRAFRVFLHQNQNPTIKQTWDTAWKRAQKIFHARSMQDMEEKLAAAQAEIEKLRAEVEEWKRVAAAQAELHGEAEARAERLAEALEEIQSRSAMNLAMRSDQFGLTARLGDIHQIADAALAQEQENKA